MKIQDMNKIRLKREVKTIHTHIKENTELKRIKMVITHNKSVNH
jgi:hypothetical protein